MLDDFLRLGIVPVEIDLLLAKLKRFTLRYALFGRVQFDWTLMRDEGDAEYSVMLTAKGLVPERDKGSASPLFSARSFTVMELLSFGPNLPTFVHHAIRQLLVTMCAHEIDEQLCFDNRRILDPHTGERLRLDGDA